jgi:hypothetical protein
MRTPAPPPPTQRPVVKAALAPAPESEAEEHADVAPDAAEPETTEGAMPTDMTALFNSLMKAG